MPVGVVELLLSCPVITDVTDVEFAAANAAKLWANGSLKAVVCANWLYSAAGIIVESVIRDQILNEYILRLSKT